MSGAEGTEVVGTAELLRAGERFDVWCKSQDITLVHGERVAALAVIGILLVLQGDRGSGKSTVLTVVDWFLTEGI